MDKPKALIIAGGWEGHSPKENAELFQTQIEAKGVEVRVETSLDAFSNAELLSEQTLIIPMWTMGTLTGEQENALSAAVQSGVGLGGTHGGMGDAFRGAITYEWMVGGHFVGHPHVGEYEVVRTGEHPITAPLPERFAYDSEQYYLLTDPSINVLATTQYTHEGKTCTMPVVWTKEWGKGRVFYSALGHKMEEFSQHPYVLEMTVNGLLWAARVI